jgi:iron-regulated transporter 1
MDDDMQIDAGTNDPVPNSSLFVLLYVQTFLASFGERLWGFAVPMLLATMYPKNMWPAATLAFIETMSGFLSGPTVGALIDRSSRLAIMRVALVGQNVSIVVASGCFYALVWFDLGSADAVPYDKWTFWVPMLCLYLVAALNSVAALADSVSIKKIWVPAICHGNEDLLRSTNASMRRINLLCEVGAPLAFGLMLSFLPKDRAISISILVVVVWNIVSFVPELVTLQAIYNRVPLLAESSIGTSQPVKNPLREALHGWHSYVNHNVFLASLAYALLFVTVLMPGVLMTSFLIFWKIEQWEIAVFRGLCAITGILATLIATPVMKKVGIVRAGVIFSWFQWGFLVPATIAVFLPNFGYVWGLYVFMAMVILSRMGLWGFDLVEVHIMQTGVRSSEAGAINSVEYSATQLGSLLPYLVGIFSNDPTLFVWLVVGSSLSILGAAILFTVWARKKSHGYADLQHQEMPMVPTISSVTSDNTSIDQEE